MKSYLRMEEKVRREETNKTMCEICGSELEVDTESGEAWCPVCDISEEEW